MPDVKIGMNQMNKPAPLGYRKFQNAMIIFLIPGAVGMIQGWGMADKTANRWLMILGFLPAVIKGVGILLGNGQEYVPTNQSIESQSSESPKP